MTAVAPMPAVDVRRAADRFTTRLSWLDSKHSFSFSRHYDPANTHHGLLLVNNDDVVHPGTGFETHPHQDMEIVTWVLRGSLVHQDSTGHSGVIYPGLAQRMSAGTGILHSEKNDAWRLAGTTPHDDPVHFVQMWVIPDEEGSTPGTSSWRSATSCSAAAWSRSPPAWTSTTARPRSGSATGTPPCTPPGSPPATR
ncbi:pirin family protein [Micromonospora sp. ATA51]|uniref:pirin family protein n=1 Tax=Micromonospora sp. ATA51 TaxID=2806098 RepID=UPI001EE3D88E|nr:pirin family protein [Micromonospora sp. ATA51]